MITLSSLEVGNYLGPSKAAVSGEDNFFMLEHVINRN